MRRLFIVALATSLCAACGGGGTEVADPNRITLGGALVDTVRALNAAAAEAHKPGNQAFGYYPCTLTANFNVGATSSASNNLGGTLGLTTPSGTATGITAGTTNGTTGTRGNAVTVVLVSPLCAPAAPAAKAAAPGAAAPASPLPPPLLLMRPLPPGVSP